jgi:hypothetical protein
VLVLMGTMRKRERYMQFLRQVPILASLSDMEVMAVADTLGVEEFCEQAVICAEGEVGDKFYIIEVCVWGQTHCDVCVIFINVFFRNFHH